MRYPVSFERLVAKYASKRPEGVLYLLTRSYHNNFVLVYGHRVAGKRKSTLHATTA
jgi:hypothetical protein